MSAPRINRRRFLLAGGGLLAAAGAYTYWRGVRLPLLHFTGGGPATAWAGDGVEVAADGALFQRAGEDALRFRAFVPEPRFTVRGGGGRTLRLRVENLHPGARLAAGAAPAALDEARDNLAREVSLAPAGGASRFAWRFPDPEQYRFAVIGDSGGGTELQWVLARAAALGAGFLIHLGDFYYQPGDIESTPQVLNAAAIPTYAAMGNHDFSIGRRALYSEFLRTIGPANARFSLGGIQFLCFDTAADFVPAARGPRGRLLESLRPPAAVAGVRDRVTFTHAPLRDPDPERDHAVGREAERAWLRARLDAGGVRTLLAGHIHIRDEFDDGGLHTYIAGQGLAHADLITGRPYADILLGEVEPGAPVRYQWQPLNMPFAAHCSERNLAVLEALGRPEVKAELRARCRKAGGSGPGSSLT